MIEPIAGRQVGGGRRAGPDDDVAGQQRFVVPVLRDESGQPMSRAAPFTSALRQTYDQSVYSTPICNSPVRSHTSASLAAAWICAWRYSDWAVWSSGSTGLAVARLFLLWVFLALVVESVQKGSVRARSRSVEERPLA